MIPLKFLNKQEKEKLVRQLNEQFGIKEVHEQIARLGKERIILFSGEVSEKEIQILDRFARIEGVGVYFAKNDEKTDNLRLSIEGTQLLKNQITKNIFELDEKQAEEWMMGQDLNITTGKKGFYIIKFKDDFLGTGKISETKFQILFPSQEGLNIKKIK